MKQPHKFAGMIRDNKLYFSDQQFFNDKIKELEGETVLVTIAARKNLRSLNQNALYWEWLTILSHEIGYTKDEWHVLLKKMYFGAEQITGSLFGQELMIELVSTTTITIKQMSEYMTWIKQKVWDFYQIDLPDSVRGFEYKEEK